MNTVIFLLAAGTLPVQPAAEPAVLVCPTPVAARGEIKGGPPLVQTFELTHRGTGTLTIGRVEASCGCLRQSLTSGILQPGETARLTLEVNTLTQPDGPNRWQVVVPYRSEAPGAMVQTGELLLQITATVSREVSVSPPQVGFSTATEASQTITLTDSRARPLTVLRATTSNPHLVTDVKPKDPRFGHQQTILLKLSSDSPPGHRDETLVLATDDPAYPELRIPVRILKRLPGTIQAAPEKVSIRFAPGQAEVSTLLQLRATDGKPIAIADVVGDHPAVKVKWSPAPTAGVVAALRISIVESAASPSGTTVVRVKFSEPGGQELEIPVSWTSPKKER
jgi:hypothetical protein